MQRTLYLVRHAKAEDRNYFEDDHERNLVPEGVIAAARMGSYLCLNDVQADVIITSIANRAKDTAKIVAEQLHFDSEKIVVNEHLFDGGPRSYLTAVNNLPDTCASAMIIGHNPDISYFAEFLTHQDVGSMSTAAVAAVTFDNLQWAEISNRTGHLAFYISPRQLPQD